MVIVKKPDDQSHRVCIDFRKLNKITVFDAEPMTQMSEIFARLTSSQSLTSRKDTGKLGGTWR